MRKLLLATTIVIPTLARADLFVPSSTFTDSGTNTPTTFSQSVALTPGSTVVDSGALNLNIAVVNSGFDEWLVFNYSTIGNVPLSQPGSDWSINQTGLLVGGQDINFIGAYSAWFIDGASTAPTASIFGGYTPGPSPVPGDTSSGLVIGGFTAPFAANTAIGALGAFINPYDFLDATGIVSASVTGYEQALEFAPQTPPPPVPEPVSLLLLASGLVGLGLAKRRLG